MTKLQHLGSDRLNEIFRLAIGAPIMSAIWGFSENIYSLRVLPPMTPSGARADAEQSRRVGHHPGNVANRKCNFRGHGRSLKPTSFTSVSDRCPTTVVTKEVRSER